MRCLNINAWAARALAVILCLAAGGCGMDRILYDRATTQPATKADPKTAEPSYYLAQPATAQVAGRDFTTLWDACEDVARDYLFRIDRRDYRAGLLSTEPMISKQLFEPWRRDAGTEYDMREASLAAVRRTIQFQFTQNLDGTYTVATKVVVERQSKIEPKYRTDPNVPVTYWYALRRDTVMEGRVAQSLREKLGGRGVAAGGE